MRFQNNSLFERLTSLSESGIYPYHMPGHKRNMNGYPMEQFYRIDITEIDDFDNLHEPKEILLALQERIQSFYHTEKTFCLINGSSCGVLSAVSACSARGGSLMLARNSHKSVYHALFQEELNAVYLYPEYNGTYGLYGAVPPQEIEEAFRKYPECRTVLITSPTYEGIVSNIREIADIVHRYGGILIVDEAHGAHLIFTGQEEKSAIGQGADIVIHSIHKTLPAPTQTALLHICSRRVDRERVERYLKIYQSSSPSYVLLAGIEQCFAVLEQEAGLRNRFFQGNMDRLRKRIEACRHLSLIPDTETGKLAIALSHGPWTGQMLYETLLKKYDLQMEMAAENYVVAIMTLMDTQEGYDRLADALEEIDDSIEQQEDVTVRAQSYCAFCHPETVMTIREALAEPGEKITLEESSGRISAEYVGLYPPGIPLAVPGERYTKELVETLTQYERQGLRLQGVDENRRVSVLSQTYL